MVERSSKGNHHRNRAQSGAKGIDVGTTLVEPE